ncbi:MAG TPA: NAD(P)-binding protein [Candidatus Acidoferrum sp.]|nr:NAD(P)-binding protein [Candidatus Acidoferrum sp.]
MPAKKLSTLSDSLGLQSRITRRDFLNSSLLASGGALLEGLSPVQLLSGSIDDQLTGYGGLGDYSSSNGNTLSVLTTGHSIRDGKYNTLPADLIETREVYDCVIVGGGISGLAAALFFQRYASKQATCLVLENHPIFGGEAKENEFLVDGHRLIAHQGSAIYQLQHPWSFLSRFYDSIGMTAPELSYQTWTGPEPELTLSRTPYESAGLERGQYGFYFGAKFGSPQGLWQIDPIRTRLDKAPISEATRREWLRFLSGENVHGARFVHPKVEGDAASRYLDSITLEQHLMNQFALSRETIRTFLSPVEGGGSGLGPDALSAYSDYAYETLYPVSDESGRTDQMFPGGNTIISRLMAKTLIPASIDGPLTPESVSRHHVDFAALDSPNSQFRIRLNATAVHVQHQSATGRSNAEPGVSIQDSPAVEVAYLCNGRIERVSARSVIMAGGSWTSKHIIKDLPELQRRAYAQFFRSPCLMANVALRNWRFLYKMGISGCRWFEGFGNYFDVRKQALVGLDNQTIGPDSPTVLSVKVLYSYPGLSTEDQGHHGRGELLSTSFAEYESQIREQFTQMFGHAGFDARRDIAGIILNRWGHAYLSPQPGFFFGTNGAQAPREVLRSAPFGRIAFANTDLAGAMDHRFSILEAQRAVSQLLDQVL